MLKIILAIAAITLAGCSHVSTTPMASCGLRCTQASDGLSVTMQQDASTVITVTPLNPQWGWYLKDTNGIGE